MHRYEVRIADEVLAVEADTWRRDLDTGAVVFVQRYRDATTPLPLERELLRVRIERPHTNIRRL